MSAREPKVVMYDSPEAASVQTVTGWVSSNGFFYGPGEQNERTARYAGSTHRTCENNPAHPIYETRSYCEACHADKRAAKFARMARAEWDFATPLVTFDGDDYFFDAEAVRDYLLDNDIAPADAQLVICKPNKPSHITTELWEDKFPEDSDCEVSEELQAAMDVVNALIDKEPPLSWHEGDTVAVLPADFLSDSPAHLVDAS